MLEISRIRNSTIGSATLFLEAFIPGLSEIDKETILFRVQSKMEATQTNDKLLHFISQVVVH
jgi:hypothetical protein